MQIADKEIGRKEEHERTLEFLSQEFAHLELVDVLPNDLEQRGFVVNRALDVRSASMMYLSRHDPPRRNSLELQVLLHSICTLTRLGKVVKTFLLGDVKITDSKAYLNNSVENYHRTLSDIVGIRMIIKVWEIVKRYELMS